MRFSFVIIGKNRAACQTAIEAVENLDTDVDFEIVVATGANPSSQRNRAVHTARGEYIIFLDNDSKPDRKLLRYYQDALTYDAPGAIGVVGGPSIYSGQKSLFKLAVQSVMSSVFGLGPFRSRYVPSGKVRKSNERELILCNMMIERDLFMRERGFNTNLYPNEENEFLNRIGSRTKIMYHPLAICYRDPRSDFFGFARQVFGYGAGRAKHYLFSPEFWNHLFLVPCLFSLYILGLLGLMLFTNGGFGWVATLALAAPLLLYGMLAVAATLFTVIGQGRIELLAAMPALFFSCHFFYGLGFFYGIGKGLARRWFGSLRSANRNLFNIDVYTHRAFLYRPPQISIVQTPVAVAPEERPASAFEFSIL